MTKINYVFLIFMTTMYPRVFEKYDPEKDAAQLETILKQHEKFLFNPGVTVDAALDYFATQPRVYLLKEADRVIGFINCIVIDNTLCGCTLYKQGLINGIAVNDEYRRQGHGKELLEYGLALFSQEGVSSAVATVHSDNIATLSFFKKAGFEHKETFTEHDVPNELLEKKLSIFNRYFLGNLIHRYRYEILTTELLALGYIIMNGKGQKD